jgi:two-component system OmpR family response regulator
MSRVLVVEDDERMARLLTRALTGAGLTVHWAPSGDEGLATALRGDFDLVLLDLVLPGMDGAEVLRRLVEARPHQRVLVLSGASEVANRVASLEAGADDFLGKPFAVAELLARVRARMRVAAATPASPHLAIGPVRLDLRLHRAHLGDRRVDLSSREFLLLQYLMSHADQVCSRPELLAAAWGESDHSASNVLDACIRRLRGKLGAPAWLETVRNGGYRYVVEDGPVTAA